MITLVVFDHEPVVRGGHPVRNPEALTVRRP